MAVCESRATGPAITEALAACRFETARRLAHQVLRDDPACSEVRLALHEALRRLGDVFAAERVLLEDKRLSGSAMGLALLAEDSVLLTQNNSYRTSPEQKQGLSLEEYQQKFQALADERFAAAIQRVQTDEDRSFVAKALRATGRHDRADALSPPTEEAEQPIARAYSTGALQGQVVGVDGERLAGVSVTLGLDAGQDPVPADAATAFDSARRKRRLKRPDSLTARTDAGGNYRFEAVPTGCHPFLSITLSAESGPIPVRFVARDIEVSAGRTKRLNVTVSDWRSAEEQTFDSPFPSELAWKGESLRRVLEQQLINPFWFDFPRQPLELDLPDDAPRDPAQLRLFCSDDPASEISFQLHGDRVVFMAELPARAFDGPVESRSYAMYQTSPEASGEGVSTDGDTNEWLTPAGNGLVELSSGVASFRLPLGEGAGDCPPLHQVRARNGPWRGRGRWVLPEGLTVDRWRSECVAAGPVFCEMSLTYLLSSGVEYRWIVRLYRGEQTLLVRETSPAIDGAAFEFSLGELEGGRGYLHWNAENGSVHWSDLAAEDRELARLQESVPWWIPPSGFGYAMTPDTTDSDEPVGAADYIAVYTRRRGEWIDRRFEAICRGPGDDRREWDWPFPEMVGSTISMITAESRASGDQLYRFGLFDGERQWGILASTLGENDGPDKRISRDQHKYSAPRLQDFKDWNLDEPDRVARPSVVTTRDELPGLVEKKDRPAFAALFKRMKHNPYPHGKAGRGLSALIEADPVELWMIKQDLADEAPIRSRMTLLGREFSDMYSPVGARPITPHAENYDLIAATGVFSPEEERLCRAFFLLMGHLYQEPDLMNWRYGSRNANFEADRVDVVGAVGVAFRGNADADAMIQHAADLMESSLNAYCTPGSGKWYENPACYYLHASSCRLNLAWHLYQHGILDPTRIARLKDYLSWGPNILTPPMPADEALLRRGSTAREYDAAAKARKIPPIGDHAHLGQWVGEFNALMAKAYDKRDPDLSHLLRWAYHEGGCDGGHFNNYPLLFVNGQEEDLEPVEPIVQPSRRLEGFGAIFRGKQNTPEEFYCLFKLGPGGYRYHRTEGSIILFADGKPLIFDGGEAGETWRHTTLSFDDTHASLAAGHIERFVSFSSLDFAQGVNPKALSPGEPAFLSDSCEHNLVQEAERRFNEPRPANSRTCLWVKDDYLILHDQLQLAPGRTTHWHLQAVADEHRELGPGNRRFIGRYGTDLQVLLPNQTFERVTVTQTPMIEKRRRPEDTFSMRHLQATCTSPASVLGVLRPLPGSTDEVNASVEHLDAGGVIVHVWASGIDDYHLLDREPGRRHAGAVQFEGRYASLLRRGSALTLCIVDGGFLAAEGFRLDCNGVQAEAVVDLATGRWTLTAQGAGIARLHGPGISVECTVAAGDGRKALKSHPDQKADFAGAEG